MEAKLKEQVEKKLRDGWIKSTMMIECLAVTKDAVKSALEKHILDIEKEKKTIVYKKDWSGITFVKNPMKSVAQAYSYVVELELITENYEQLIWLVMNFGPSSVEILEPGKIQMDVGEAQGILNSVADMIHRFAAMGIGGVVIRT